MNPCAPVLATLRTGALSAALALACWVSQPASAQGSESFDTLKDRAASGDAAARVELVQELLMSLPGATGAAAPERRQTPQQ